MCQTLAQGGKRCAAETRPAYDALMAAMPTHSAQAVVHIESGHEAIRDYSRTKSGRPVVEDALRTLEHRYATTPAVSIEDEMARQRTLVSFQSAIEAGERDDQVAASLASLTSESRPTSTSMPTCATTTAAAPAWTAPAGWRDWYPTPIGDTPTDAWVSAAHDPVWVAAWNAVPPEHRRPLLVVHGSQTADTTFRGHAHFGDLNAAMDRLYNTMDDPTEGTLHVYHYRGDIAPTVLPDTVANLVVHPHEPYGNSFYDRMADEIGELGADDDPDEYVDRAQAMHAAHPGAAIAYVNNTEGSADGEGISLAVDTTSPHLVHVETRQITDEDLEYIS